MIDVKKATEIAIQYFKDLYPDKLKKISLEEVELSTNEEFWYITLGFDQKIESMFNGLAPDAFERKYKKFKIDTKEGKVWSMKIREI